MDLFESLMVNQHKLNESTLVEMPISAEDLDSMTLYDVISNLLDRDGFEYHGDRNGFDIAVASFEDIVDLISEVYGEGSSNEYGDIQWDLPKGTIEVMDSTNGPGGTVYIQLDEATSRKKVKEAYGDENFPDLAKKIRERPRHEVGDILRLDADFGGDWGLPDRSIIMILKKEYEGVINGWHYWAKVLDSGEEIDFYGFEGNGYEEDGIYDDWEFITNVNNLPKFESTSRKMNEDVNKTAYIDLFGEISDNLIELTGYDLTARKLGNGLYRVRGDYNELVSFVNTGPGDHSDEIADIVIEGENSTEDQYAKDYHKASKDTLSPHLKADDDAEGQVSFIIRFKNPEKSNEIAKVMGDALDAANRKSLGITSIRFHNDLY